MIDEQRHEMPRIEFRILRAVITVWKLCFVFPFICETWGLIYFLCYLASQYQFPMSSAMGAMHVIR